MNERGFNHTITGKAVHKFPEDNSIIVPIVEWNKLKAKCKELEEEHEKHLNIMKQEYVEEISKLKAEIERLSLPKCKECNGAGVVPSGFYGTSVNNTCRRCNGTGIAD